jgi:UDP-N-acetylmuramoyl-tripeptide--D-alanyl-D-alanine ligase
MSATAALLAWPVEAGDDTPLALWRAEEIARATGGRASTPFEVGGVAFDSREVMAGDLFLALRGESADGHRFVEGAFGRGAAGALVETPVLHPHVLVEDTTVALDALAGRPARAWPPRRGSSG